MKISQEEKAKTRVNIVEAAAKLVADQGFKDTTLRAIAREAGIADATIYKYFSCKEDILYAYFDIRLEQVMARMQNIEALHSYSFQEQFHTFLEMQFELVEKDREFLKKAYKNIFLTNIAAAAEGMRGTRDKYKNIVNEMIDAAVEVEEFPEPPFKAYVLELLWEYSLGVGNYWLYDTSENYQNTTQVIDKSLGLIVAILSSDVLGKVADLFSFMIREHVLSLLDFNRKGKGFLFD